jgi:hypothetical protein
MVERRQSPWWRLGTRILVEHCVRLYYTMVLRTGKKCIPGVVCIENMTLFLTFVLLVTVTYMYYTNIVRPNVGGNTHHYNQPVTILAPPVQVQPTALATISSNDSHPMRSVYAPPLKYDTGYGLPINIKTRGYDEEYSQMGILTRENGRGDLILPLMGRKGSNARDKYQYYTMTNSAGNIHTKLPVSVNGRSCTSDLGCDEISNGDTVYVEGYKDTFRATIYENALYSYIPW